MDWIISILGIYSIWALGEKYKHGWIVKVVSQVVWIVLAIKENLYGFIPLAVLAGCIAVINYYKWSRGKNDL